MSTEDSKVGCFHFFLLILLGINCIIVAMSHALPTFHNYTPNFYCETLDRMEKNYGCVNVNSTSNARFCTGEYIFVAEHGERSVVTDWGLICERSYLKDLDIIVYYIGISIGALIGGILSDRLGRLSVLAICLYTQGTMAVSTYIIQSYPMFLALRGLQGVFVQGLQSSTYILTLELFSTKFRTLVFSIMGVAWALGLVLLAWLSNIIPDWRILQLAVSVPTAVTVLYIWILPESPRWLLAKGKITEAELVLEKIEKYNSSFCCFGNKTHSGLVPDNSENTTPVKPERKSRVFSDDMKSSTENEAENLLTPTNSVHRNSRRISLRAISGNLEKRLSNLTQEESIASGEQPSTSRNSKTSINLESMTEKIQNDNSIQCENSKALIINDEKTEEVNEELNVTVLPRRFFKFKNWCIVKYGTIMFLQWISIAVLNFIVTYSAPNLLEDRHINFATGGILELVIHILMYFILSRNGRRLPMCVCQSLNGGICMLIVGMVFVPRITAVWTDCTRTILLLLVRLTAMATLNVIHLYTVEIFPTVIRGTCFGLCVVAGTIGRVAAPYILLRLNYALMGPFILPAILCLVSGLFCLALPETLTKLLPDTIQDLKKLDQKILTSNRKEDIAFDREILREKLFSEDWVDAGNGIIVNFSDNKN